MYCRATNGDGSDSNSLMDISRTPQDRESRGCHNDHAVVMRFWTAALRLIASGSTARIASAITASRETSRSAIGVTYSVSSLEVMVNQEKLRLLCRHQFRSVKPRPGTKICVVPGSTLHLVSQRWPSQHGCHVNFDLGSEKDTQPPKRINMSTPSVADVNSDNRNNIEK